MTTRVLTPTAASNDTGSTGTDWDSIVGVTAINIVTSGLYTPPIRSKFLRLSSMSGGAIPGGASVSSIEAAFNMIDLNVGGVLYAQAQLYNGSTAIGSVKTGDLVQSYTLDYTFTGGSAYWGVTLTPAIVNSLSVGIRVYDVDSFEADGFITLNSAVITVTYTGGGRTRQFLGRSKYGLAWG